MPLDNKKFQVVSRKLFKIHRNERREAGSPRKWEQIHEKSASQTGGWYV